MDIKFYKTKEEYGCFSNFSRHAIEVDGIKWPTTEHYFQAQKYIGTDRYKEIAEAPTPRIAADLGRDRSLPLRADWEEIKDDIMLNAVREKARQHPQIRDILLSTGNEIIIEDSPIDYYWGCGKDGTGRNQLGKCWMKLREELLEEKL